MRSRFAARLGMAFSGLVLLVTGFVGGWMSATTLDGGIPISASVGAWIGPGAQANRGTPAELRDQFSVFWEAWNLVENEFYATKPLDRTRMIAGAISGMLASLEDPYTVYQEPELAAQTREHMAGKQAGIGTYLRITEGRAFLWKPIRNGPAVSAGLRQDDEIAMIDGTDVPQLIAGLSVNESAVKIASRLRGEANTPVALGIKRGTESFAVTLQRAEIVVPSVEAQLLDNNIGYLRIAEFKTNTTEEFDAAVRTLLPQQPRALIVDLRNNPGGYLQNAQDVLGRFYSGVALHEADRNGAVKTLYTNDGTLDTRIPDMPVIVLVNGNSASASEIVAGALRDSLPNVRLLGEKSYGKGSVQNIHTLSNSASARITFAHWLTPNNREIQKVGLQPDIAVPYSEDQQFPAVCVADKQPAPGASTCYDSQLHAAVGLLR